MFGARSGYANQGTATSGAKLNSIVCGPVMTDPLTPKLSIFALIDNTGGLTVVVSIAVSDGDPPPLTTTLLASGGVPWDPTTDTVIAGYVAPAASTSLREHWVFVQFHPTPVMA